jgi:glycosyltransferase involved in cell wall biosynthesis
MYAKFWLPRANRGDDMNAASLREQAPFKEALGERIRVLLFTNSVAVGGMEEHVELLARHLDRQRFEVFAVCPDSQPIEAFSRSLGEAADHTALITPDRRHGLRRMVIETFRLARQLRQWRIQVIHMHSTTYQGQYYAFLAARLAGVQRIYITEHLAPDQKLPRRERLMRDLFSRMISGIVCVSQKNYQARATYLYTPTNRTIVVNNGVDLGDFPPVPAGTLAQLRVRHQLPDDAQIVGTAVRFEPEKGLNYLIQAMPQIKAACPKAHFLMVGDGSLRAELETQVASLGLTDTVRFVGFQSDPHPYLGLMDAFVLPVPVGSMSIGLLEAMAMERAVVITFGGKGEAVIHGVSGFWAEPRNPASIAQFVTQILQDPELQRSLGYAARQRVAEHFSAQRVARVLGELYRNGLAATNTATAIS